MFKEVNCVGRVVSKETDPWMAQHWDWIEIVKRRRICGENEDLVDCKLHPSFLSLISICVFNLVEGRVFGAWWTPGLFVLGMHLVPWINCGSPLDSGTGRIYWSGSPTEKFFIFYRFSVATIHWGQYLYVNHPATWDKLVGRWDEMRSFSNNRQILISLRIFQTARALTFVIHNLPINDWSVSRLFDNQPGSLAVVVCW